MSTFDCLACGACCANAAAYSADGAAAPFVMVDDAASPLLRHPVLKRLVVEGDAGAPFLAVTEEGRCVALEGEVAVKVRCVIYELRPAGCREVEPGSEECLAARRARGIDPLTSSPNPTRG
jgi:Fe-S-cluster containining protein